jgi:hypothetical protein
MVMVTDGTQLYASHLPLYVKPHDFQLVYVVESKFKEQLIERLTRKDQGNERLYQQNMVTLLPAKFDLNKLINGQSFEIETQFFKGHFERGGDKWFKDNKLKFVRQAYKRPLAGLKKTANSDASNWHLLNAKSSERQLFIYPIQTAPSFDAIVLAKGCSDAKSVLATHFTQVPELEELKNAVSPCKSSQILYFETRDFMK